MASKSISIFFSYSRKDEALMLELERHLTSLERSQIISNWHDGRISPGEECEPLLKRYLEKAQIILLLISVDFISSDYCYNIELTKAIERHKSGQVRVIPIILRDCDWEMLPIGGMLLGDLQALPKNAVPVNDWDNRDKAFANITREIRQTIQEIRDSDKSVANEALRINSGNQKIDRTSKKPKNKPIFQKNSNHSNIQSRKLEQTFALSRSEVEILSLDETTSEELGNPQDSIAEIVGIKVFDFETVRLDLLGNPTSILKNQAFYISRNLGEKILDLVFIPGGDFLMGSSEEKAYPEELPVHSVRISPFLIGMHPITKEQWQFVSELPKIKRDLDRCPSKKGGRKHPVTRVSWEDAHEFCDRLSRFLGEKYRLPTEAEWEYSCRAGSLTAYYFGNVITSNFVNFDGRYPCHYDLKDIFRGGVTRVGELKYANQFGLFDMHGNVWEWCKDSWHESYVNAPNDSNAWEDESSSSVKVMRGGSWLNEALKCRSAYRQRGDLNHRSENTGLRIARDINL